MVGYEVVTKVNVLVKIDQISKVNFDIKATVIEGESVIIVAERDILHEEVSGSQLVVTNEQLFEAPAIRTLQTFLEKQPSVSGNLEIRGGSQEQTGTIVDGFTFVDNRLGEPTTAIPLSAIEQTSIKSGGYNAEDGNFRSGIIDIVTKKGSRSKYNGRIDLSMDNPHMKRYGRSMYDINNFYLRPLFDPDVGFVGTNTAWADNNYLRGQYDSFKGWNSLADDYNTGKVPEEQVTPLDLYLWAAWLHMVEPPWDQLQTKGYDLSRYEGGIIEKFANHAHEPEGEHSDWNIDFGFGGPVPIISKFLGDASFYLSHNSKESYFIFPVTRPSVPDHTSMLTVRTDITQNLKLSLTGYRRQVKSLINSVKSHHIPTGIGPLMPINNIGVWMEDDYVYMPEVHSKATETTYMFGFNIEQVVSPSTYWKLTANATDFRTIGATPWAETGISIDQFWDEGWFDPARDNVLLQLGPIKVNNMPYGFSSGSQVVDGFAHTTYETPFGSPRRFASVGPSWFDSTKVRQYNLRLDLTSQFTPHHLLKVGIQADMNTLHHFMRSAWFGHQRGAYTFFYDRHPWNGGLYLQDQITYEGFVANLGLRADYYDPSGNWPKTNVYSKEAYGPGGLEEVMEERWDALGILEPVEKHLAISPRLGLSFPITERSKFYFNYGHFRGLPPWLNMFQVRYRPQVQVQVIGNPNMEPARTISYETGVEYNLSDMFLIHIAGYYKDVTGQHGSIRYTGLSGESNFQSFDNNNYEDIRGLEIQVTRNLGKWITGWANLDYLVERDGNIGRSTYYEDPAKEATQGLYAGAEERPLPRPSFNANISFHTPMNWGSEINGFYPMGGWMLSVLPSWRKGAFFTWNPLGDFHLENNLRWPDRFVVDMRLTKRHYVKGLGIEAYLDITNLFNNKVNYFSSGYCFSSNTDQTDYLRSLHLSFYDSPEFDQLREQNPGQFIAGDDKPGDLRSEDKPYINDPNRALWMYLQPRDIWFGINFYF